MIDNYNTQDLFRQLIEEKRRFRLYFAKSELYFYFDRDQTFAAFDLQTGSVEFKDVISRLPKQGAVFFCYIKNEEFP